MRRHLATLIAATAALLCPAVMQAGDEPAWDIDARLEARGDYRLDQVDGQRDRGASGLKCTIADLYVRGTLARRLSYKYRQRFNGLDRSKWIDQTDWLYLACRLSPNWEVMAGKWAVLVGCWEFDPAPIDIMQVSEFAYQFPCYQWGGYVQWNSTSKADQVYLQVVRSPFAHAYHHATGNDKAMWGGCLMWYGHHGPVHTSWSANLYEYRPGHYINYVCLGTTVDITPQASINLDVANRSTGHHRYLMKDYSVMGRVDYQPSPYLKAWGKVTYDNNHTGREGDMAVATGTDLTSVGAGVEVFPLKNESVRLHVNYRYSWGRNGAPSPVMRDKEHMLDVGVSWKLELF